jgi:colicin import membrane protein
MMHSHYIGKEPSLQKIIIISAVLHVLFVSLAVVPLNKREREFRSYQVKLVAPMRAPGDSRGTMPEAKKKAVPHKKIRRKLPPKKIVEKPSKKIAEKPSKADMSLEKTARVSRRIEKIRAISNLSKRKKEREKAKEVAVIRKKARERRDGGSGIPLEGTGIESDSYYSLITRKIWSQWVYPELVSSGLETIISIKIDRKGKIVSQEIEKYSGNRLFDRSAVKALSKASPLPPPPFEMEIGVRFHI